MEYWDNSVDAAGVALARFVHPPMNYFCAAAVGELADLIEQWKSPDVSAVVLTGQPGRFITHYSVEELAAFAADEEDLERTGTALSEGYHGVLRSLRDLSKPVIAAISGDCMGGGLELALWCDLRLAQSGDYRIGLPEVHMGIMPGGSGTQMLARMLGTAKTMQLVLLGELLTPAQALAHGLVHAVSYNCVDQALGIATHLSGKNPCAIAQIKAAIYHGSELSLAGGLGMEALSFLAVMRSREASQGMKDYLAVETQARRQWLEQSQPL